jgi:hypothetical protein
MFEFVVEISKWLVERFFEWAASELFGRIVSWLQSSLQRQAHAGCPSATGS